MAKKRTRKRVASPSTGASLEGFASQIVKLFEERYREMESRQPMRRSGMSSEY